MLEQAVRKPVIIYFRLDDASVQAVQQDPDSFDGSSTLYVVNLVALLQELSHSVNYITGHDAHERLDVPLHFLERALSWFFE